MKLIDLIKNWWQRTFRKNRTVEQAKILSFPALKTFAESYRLFLTFQCDGSCYSNPCSHRFVFKCPECSKPIRATSEEMELFVGANEDAVCLECGENSLRKVA